MAQPRAFGCPVEAALSVIGGRWKILVICRLFEDKQRFNEMRRSIPGSSQRMLTQSLREPEHDGIVARKVFPESPPHVEYALTAFGRSLEPVLDRLCECGESFQLRGMAPLPRSAWSARCPESQPRLGDRERRLDELRGMALVARDRARPATLPLGGR
jgi:DNA-binding HxlR family transcriptional regulator